MSSPGSDYLHMFTPCKIRSFRIFTAVSHRKTTICKGKYCISFYHFISYIVYVPARVLVKKQQRPIWLEQPYFHGKHCQNWNNITLWVAKGKGQNTIRENDRKTYAFPGFKRHRVVETTKTLRMLRSNDVSKDRHATVTNVTQKAHGCRYSILCVWGGRSS